MEKECNSEAKGQSDDSTICKIPEAQSETEQNTPGKKAKTNAEGKENLDTSGDQAAEKVSLTSGKTHLEVAMPHSILTSL